ncbi:adhesion G-protein coupled receptor G4 isoform X1 [Xyrichtys novacula]|uniref:Adhesion G-protein coupled receptor G4 isoform X1 n=1 Tax=Xyrichtys novacula TaxID=13765 RepID=A0AAV1FDJ8_XYRNO|nr:adhesion G-protein coupled receptor G4 isoform X1 [Xyrichtys novacula]
MKSFRNLSSPTLCLSILLAGCLLSTDNHSLWGKKITFMGRQCLWQLDPSIEVPALEELSVCVRLRFTTLTEWTGFVYKAPWGRSIELGLQGTGEKLSVFLFGEEVSFEKKLKSDKWYSACITWSGQAQMLHVYINGDSELKAHVDHSSSRHLTPNGTLTLGASHFVSVDGTVKKEDGKDLLGEIGLFRMWAREWSSEDIKGESCADGDVVSWDLRQWKTTCPTDPDSSLHCAWSHYKIKMLTFMDLSLRAENCSVPLEGVTRKWLESALPPYTTVREISVSSPSRSCPVVNNSAALHVQQPQGPWTSFACEKCFSCEAVIDVNPAADVDVVQADVIARLSETFSPDNLNLTADRHSITVLPVESFPEESEPAPTIGTHTTTSAVTGPTQSLQTPPSNMSTTGGPLDLNETTIGPDIFFKVNLTLSLTGSPTNTGPVITKWLKERLEVNNTMIILNLIIKGGDSRYNCIFHVQEYNINSVEVTETLINVALTSKYEGDSYIIQTTSLSLKHIEPENCLEETTSTVYGEYIWPEAFPQVMGEMACRKPLSERAYRLCKLDIETDRTSWAVPDMTRCKRLMSISDLENITVSTDNAKEVVDMIQALVDDQLGNSSEMSSSDLDAVVEKLNEVVDVSVIKPDVGADIVYIVADILLSKTNITPVASTVLNLTERMANGMDFEDESISVTAPSLALSMVNVAPSEFTGLTFGVSSISPTQNPKVFINQSFVSEALPGSDATISLPTALHDLFPGGLKTRIQFQFYGTSELFQDPEINTGASVAVNSYIVSASVNSSRISNLTDPVVVTLNHQKPKKPKDKVRCVFWDFQKNAGQGGWNSRGCVTWSVSSNRTSCRCNHLTHFAVLLEVAPRLPVKDPHQPVCCSAGVEHALLT